MFNKLNYRCPHCGNKISIFSKSSLPIERNCPECKRLYSIIVAPYSLTNYEKEKKKQCPEDTCRLIPPVGGING